MHAGAAPIGQLAEQAVDHRPSQTPALHLGKQVDVQVRRVPGHQVRVGGAAVVEEVDEQPVERVGRGHVEREPGPGLGPPTGFRRDVERHRVERS